MQKTLLFHYFVMFALLLVSPGCQQEEAPPVRAGLVTATEAYLESFGTPPQGKSGRAYAAVVYLPTKEMPGKLLAFPVFLYTEESQLEKVLEKLISGDLVSSEKMNVYNPFPGDLEFVIESLKDDVLTLNLNISKQWAETDQKSAVIALRETALQFNEVSAVKIMLNGSFVSGMPKNGFQHQQGLIAQMTPPKLILMAGVWEEGQETPEEILIEFDRPIKIKSFNLYHSDGKKIEGDYYTSIFQMAVVLHPERPELFKEGAVLRAEWSVVDYLGRANSGVDMMALKKYLH